MKKVSRKYNLFVISEMKDGLDSDKYQANLNSVKYNWQ